MMKTKYIVEFKRFDTDQAYTFKVNKGYSKEKLLKLLNKTYKKYKSEKPTLAKRVLMAYYLLELCEYEKKEKVVYENLISRQKIVFDGEVKVGYIKVQTETVFKFKLKTNERD